MDVYYISHFTLFVIKFFQLKNKEVILSPYEFLIVFERNI